MLEILVLAAAQAAQAPAPPPFRASGGFFAVSVADADREAEWFAKVLGTKVAVQTPKRGGVRMVAVEGDGVLIEIIENEKAVPLSSAMPKLEGEYLIHGVFKGGLLVEDWDGLSERLKRVQIPIFMGPFAATKDMRANLILRDPEGNLIQLLGPYAR